MSKKCLLFYLFMVSAVIFGQESTRKIEYHTAVSGSFYHLGSYSKERPSLYVEQGLAYPIGEKLKLSLQVGINVYPAVFALPISLGGHYTFNPEARFPITTTHLLGRNIKAGELFFVSNRYWGNISTTIQDNERLTIMPELGYSLLWDRYGIGALSFTFGLRFCY